jgi:hypothetical protein
MSTLSDLIKKNDPKDEKFESIKTSLDTLEKLAGYKLKELQETIDKQLTDKLKFKITHQEDNQSFTHVTASDDAEGIKKAVDAAIDGFCMGSSDGTKKAVSAIIGAALNALLGAGEGSELYKQSYAAIAEDEILKRIDVAFWSYGIAAKGISEKKQTAITYVYVKSFIDAKDVYATELTAMYAEAVRLAGSKEDKKDILDALADAVKILKAMKDDSSAAENNHMRVARDRLLNAKE